MVSGPNPVPVASLTTWGLGFVGFRDDRVSGLGIEGMWLGLQAWVLSGLVLLRSLSPLGTLKLTQVIG